MSQDKDRVVIVSSYPARRNSLAIHARNALTSLGLEEECVVEHYPRAGQLLSGTDAIKLIIIPATEQDSFQGVIDSVIEISQEECLGIRIRYIDDTDGNAIEDEIRRQLAPLDTATVS